VHAVVAGGCAVYAPGRRRRHHDGPVTGAWSQPAGPTSLRFEFFNAQGATAIIYEGTATSSRCVEGLSYSPTMVRIGAFRACAQ